MVLAKYKSTQSKLGVLFLFLLVVGLLVCSNSLQTHSVTNPENSSNEEFAFTEIGQWIAEEGVYALDVTIDGDIAYVCTGDYVAILDVSDPTEPSLLGKFNQFGSYLGEIPWPEQIITYGDYIFVLAYWHDYSYCWTNKIMVLDVSNPANPLLVQEFNIQRLIYDICLVDNFLYVASSGDFRIYNVELANAPYLIGNFSADNFFPGAIGIHGSYAFLGSHANGYLVLDISSPTNPFMVKNCTDFSITRIHFEESIAYTLTRPALYGSAGRNFIVFNLTDSYDLEEINRLYVSEENWDFIFSDGYIYMKTCSSDFRVLNASNLNHLEFVYQSSEEELDAQGFSIVGNDFYLAAGAEGLLIYEVNYPPITITLNQSAFLIFIVGVFACGIFLKRKRR
ncbi:MAG: hypothetical protein KGD59_13565 [Candidatus Heimdallarchaeota archaeon]|nr:hypothetical protein [Candidatus Heimdallarchaeota archaeon]MBY8995572.1 hypothetical protein [Candidatus Heimdallarchaeota archaeon]